MSQPTAPPGWYPDPGGPGRLRYFDGSVWTAHVVAAPPPSPGFPATPPTAPPAPPPDHGRYPPSNPYASSYGWGGPPQWKGARYGLPQYGPGALASQWRRWGARLLDALVLLPVTLAVEVPLLIYAAHHDAGWTVTTEPGSDQVTLHHLYRFYLFSFVAAGLIGVIAGAYTSILTGLRGRTLGKQWLGIRPVRTDGGPLSWGRAVGRAASFYGMGVLWIVGLLDELWCLWDGERQCLHDKVVDTVVINDPAPAPGSR